jgi:hypothetical protein
MDVHAGWYCVHVPALLWLEETMPTRRTRSHKHFRSDTVKIKRAQKLLKAGCETEAIDRALDLVISEHERNRLAAEANERFVKSGIAVKDVYGTLEP